MTRRPPFTFIDLFAGIGGFRLALQNLGGTCLFSSDWDRFARQTYAANFGDEPAGDIREVDVETIPAHDLLTAGFPCQPFSISGVSKKNSLGRPHGFADRTQGTLFFEIVRILDAHRPRAFILENVRNLRNHDRGRTFDTIIRVLRDDLGYDVHADVLDARHVVPQHRERIFIVGFREPRPFDFPKLETDRAPRLRDILQKNVDAKYTLSDKLWQYLQDYARKHQAAGNGFGFGLADLNGTTRTLSARYFKDGSEILVPQRGGKNPRRLTPRECARLMGYPDTFEIPVSDTQAYRQFGNSVAVPVVEAVGAAVLQALECESELLSAACG